MNESDSSKSMLQLQSGSGSAIRFRRKRDELKEQFVKNRMSGDFGSRLSSDTADDTNNNKYVLSNTKVDTLDPATDEFHHNLRPLLRKMVRQNHLWTIDDNLDSGWGTWSRVGESVKITDFGMIDTPPPPEDSMSYHSLQHQAR